jgi:hypothetical protein
MSATAELFLVRQGWVVHNERLDIYNECVIQQIAVQLTMDHSPKNNAEKDRIEAAGGWVQKGRYDNYL